MSISTHSHSRSDSSAIVSAPRTRRPRLAAGPSARRSRSGWPADAPEWRWWRTTWYDHHNLRDERAEAFASLLSAGVYQFHYTARATTPGAFVVPPATAEEMYAPETFARTAGDRVIITAGG